jgi:hypothetical protein
MRENIVEAQWKQKTGGLGKQEVEKGTQLHPPLPMPGLFAGLRERQRQTRRKNDSLTKPLPNYTCK